MADASKGWETFQAVGGPLMEGIGILVLLAGRALTEWKDGPAAAKAHLAQAVAELRGQLDDRSREKARRRAEEDAEVARIPEKVSGG